MTTYKLKLSNGRTAKINASSPLKAKYKYYGSSSHFNSEASVLSVKKTTPTKKRKVKRQTGWGFGSI